MIDMRTQKPGVTPPEISIMQIDQDLKDGINKSDIAIKYGIKKWELDEVFKHPFLKGRKPSRKKMLSFKLVDDSPLAEDVTDGPIIDPNQVTLHDAIDEAIESVAEIKDQMQETQEAIIDMLSPTEFETPEETIAKVNGTEITGIPNGDTMSDTDDDELEIPSFNDTMSLVEEQEWEKSGETAADYGDDEEDDDYISDEVNQEDELEMDDDTFEL